MTRPANRGEEVYQSLRDRIVHGAYPTARLPSEPALCDEFGVSRPVVRETLARLRVEGLVTSRQGAGTFVRAPGEGREDARGIAPVRNLSDIRQCFEFRAALEGEAAFHAALHRTETDLAEVRKRAETFAASATMGDTADFADFAFHEAVATATNISFFASVITSMRQHIMVGMKLAGELSGVDIPERLRCVEAEHRVIVEAIAAARAEDAREAMRGHIENSRRRLFGETA